MPHLDCRAKADPAFRNQGTLVAFDDVIHAAACVQKCDTCATSAFQSPAPVGWIAEGRPVLRAPVSRRPAITVPADAPFRFVPILKPGLGDDPRIISAMLELGATGLVFELAGGGHTAASWLDALSLAADRVPVVFASRTRGGRVLSRIYSQRGAEIDLLRRKLRGASDLDALKARLLLILLLMADTPDWFEEFCDLSWRPDHRRTSHLPAATSHA